MKQENAARSPAIPRRDGGCARRGGLRPPPARRARRAGRGAAGAGLGRGPRPAPAAGREPLAVPRSRPRSTGRSPPPRCSASAARPTTARMTDTAGEHWQFQASGLAAGRRYTLSLEDGGGAALCEPWPLATFPGSGRRAPIASGCSSSRARAGRAAATPASASGAASCRPPSATGCCAAPSSFGPDAAVANGDHMYWDLHTWLGDGVGRAQPERAASRTSTSPPRRSRPATRRP